MPEMIAAMICTHRLLIIMCLLACAQARAARLTVSVEPRWQGQPLKLEQTGLVNAAGNKLSITRMAMLLSHAQLQRQSGQWIGAGGWVEFLDVGKGRLSFTLDGIPAETYRALRFDLGLDEETDKSESSKWPAGHPLNPDLNALHWSWRGQYVFLALEGRYTQPDGQLGGFSYHLAGQPCRGTVQVPLELDLRNDQKLTLSLHTERFFAAQHQINISTADSTHSGEDGGLAVRLADNAVQAFGIVRLEPDLSPRPLAKTDETWKPDLLADAIPPHFPPTVFPQDNPLTEAGIALGKRLFHDTRLSINNSQSCASCHARTAAFSDPRRFSLGAEGAEGTRNAMPLFNLAWKPAFFWDGRSPTLRDQVLRPIQDPLEMHEDLTRVVTKLADLAPDFETAFGTPEITADRLARALEQHLLTLISSRSKMDHTTTGQKALTEQERQGFELFFTESDPAHGIKGADCFHCHGGAHFTNNLFLNNGLENDAGLVDAGLGRVTGKATDAGKFMVPSLRNVALTAPYMHDGRFSTLEEVIDHYDHGLKRSVTLDPNLAKHLRYKGLGLSVEDKAALVAFLKTLTDEEFVR
jgi:cytochrome c peroxidase